jgi:hypothetical protein
VTNGRVPHTWDASPSHTKGSEMSTLRNVRTPPKQVSRLTAKEKREIAARKSPPRKKWANRANGVLTQEYLAWQEAHPPKTTEEVGDEFPASQGAYNHSVYYPEKYDKDLGDGAWVFVMKPPKHPGIPEVPRLSLWWARPFVIQDGQWGDRLPYQAQVVTPDGPLHLWPHEYMICENPSAFVGMEGSHIHSLGGKALLDVDHLFYLMSRGISRHEASLMLFAEIDQPGVAYMTLDDDVLDFFSGIGEPIPATSVLVTSGGSSRSTDRSGSTSSVTNPQMPHTRRA